MAEIALRRIGRPGRAGKDRTAAITADARDSEKRDADRLPVHRSPLANVVGLPGLPHDLPAARARPLITGV